MHRLERILSNRGIGSRTDVNKLIKQGRVSVAGKVVKIASQRFPSSTEIKIDNLDVYQIPLLAVYNKPVGIISTIGDPWNRSDLTVAIDEFPVLKKMHPVGRLDSDTSGLLLFSR